jgi:hypothetical protein
VNHLYKIGLGELKGKISGHKSSAFPEEEELNI